MVSVGIYTSSGEFELDQTSHLFYKFIAVVYTIPGTVLLLLIYI